VILQLNLSIHQQQQDLSHLDFPVSEAMPRPRFFLPACAEKPDKASDSSRLSDTRRSSSPPEFSSHLRWRKIIPALECFPYGRFKERRTSASLMSGAGFPSKSRPIQFTDRAEIARFLSGSEVSLRFSSLKKQDVDFSCQRQQVHEQPGTSPSAKRAACLNHRR